MLDVARYDVFELGEAVLAGDALQLARMLDGLQGEGAAPPLVLWAIAEEIRAIGRVLAGLAAGVRCSRRCAKRASGVPRQQADGACTVAATLPAVEAALQHAARIDRMVKGLALRRRRLWDELLQLGAAVFRRPARRRHRKTLRSYRPESMLLIIPWTSRATCTSASSARRVAAVAKADTATKNRALTLIAAAIERDAARLLRRERARSRRRAREKTRTPPLIDRLTLTEKSIADHGRRPAPDRALPDPIGEIIELEAAARPASRSASMRVPLGVIGDHLRIAPQRDGRCGGPVPQGRQCRHPARRLGSDRIRNQAIAECVQRDLAGAGLPETAVQVIETTDRAAVGELIAHARVRRHRSCRAAAKA